MKKNIFMVAIILFFFITLNILLPSYKDVASSTLPSNSQEKTLCKAFEKEIPSTEIYEDIPCYNFLVQEPQNTLSNMQKTKIFDEELYSKLISFLGDNINNIGLVYYNLSTNEYVGINENKNFDAASTYKVGLNLLYYYLSDNGVISLTDTIAYYDYFYQDGTGILSGYCYSGMEISIGNLLDLSIIYSDNIATAMLSSYLGGYNAVREQLYSLLNIDYVIYENLLTPEISAQILKYVYDNRYSPGFHHLIETMKLTIFHDRLDKYIPYNLVAHKIGSIDAYAHDIGFVLTEKPYLISIYTTDLYNADEIIATLSKIIYNTNISEIQHLKIIETTHYMY